MKTIIILFSFVILSFSEGSQLLSHPRAQAALRSGLNDFTEFEIYPENSGRSNQSFIIKTIFPNQQKH